MGWNTGWTILQDQSINIYNEVGKDVFAQIAKHLIMPFQGSDIDEGGKDYDFVTTDDKQMEQIFVEALWSDFDTEKIVPGDFEGRTDWDGYDKGEWAYIKAFYLIIRSPHWEDEKHTILSDNPGQ